MIAARSCIEIAAFVAYSKVYFASLLRYRCSVNRYFSKSLAMGKTNQCVLEQLPYCACSLANVRFAEAWGKSC